MSKIKIIDTLLTLSKRQTDRLRHFVGSPYFNNGYNAEQLVELLAIVVKNKKKGIDKEALQNHFFPTKPFVEKSKNAIDNLLADLNGLVEQFIAHQEFDDEIAKRSNWATARYFARIHRDDRFWPLIHRYRRQWQKRKPIDHEDWLERFQLEILAGEYDDIFKSQEKETGLATIQYYLDQFYVAQKMKLGFTGYFQQHILGKTDVVSMQQDAIWSFLYQNYPELAIEKNPIADLYYHATCWVDQPENEALLDQFHELLKTHEADLPEEELRNLYAVFRAMRGQQYRRSGAKRLIPFFLSMYKEHLEGGFFAVQGKLQASSMKLLVNMGIMAKDYEWVREVLKRFPPNKVINTRYPDEFHRLCQAELLFAEQKYAEAESTIVYRLFEDFKYSLSCDILLVKIYYETQNDLLESRIRAMELKVRRTELGDFDKKKYLNFISIVRKLMKYHWIRHEQKLAKVEQEIHSDNPLIQREWLKGVLQS